MSITFETKKIKTYDECNLCLFDDRDALVCRLDRITPNDLPCPYFVDVRKYCSYYCDLYED